MKIYNPNFVLHEDNIFNIRRKEYEKLEATIQQMLIPITEIGFEISEFNIRNTRLSTSELYRSIRKMVVIKVKKEATEIDLSMFIPDLVDDNFIIINGRRKVPLFQLFDIPVITRGESIKLRTNVASMVLMEEKDFPHLKLSFMNKKVPFALVMLAYFGPEEITNMFDLDVFNPQDYTLYEKLLIDLLGFREGNKTKLDYIKEVGTYYTKHNIKGKGGDIIYAIDLIPKVDISTKNALRTGTIMGDLIEAIKDRSSFDDELFTNKRIRCLEYMILSRISKVIFDFCITNRTSKKPKFGVNSTQILSDCNVSDIVQFDFCINPIDELTKFSRCTLVGPGGFTKDNIPVYLRDILPDMYGRVCPVDTPDRDNCGVLQNLLPNTKLDENLRFTNEILKDAPVSVPVSMVPFLEHDDQTRLQMASSQMRQAIMLSEDFDQPIIQSGCEHLYTSQTQFVKKAKKDGVVLFVNQEYLIVEYVDKSTDVFFVGNRWIYVGNIDTMRVYVRTGDKFKAGEILAESLFSDDEKIVFGKNLLTAVMIYYGYNYEDGIVISDRLVKEDVLTSISFKDLSFVVPPNKVLTSLNPENEIYKPIPNKFETIMVGQPYAKMKEIPSPVIDLDEVHKEEILLNMNKIVKLMNVKIYANNWNTQISSYNEWVEKKIDEQRQNELAFKKTLIEFTSKETAEKIIKAHNIGVFSHTGVTDQGGKYKIKGEKINGIYFEMYGVFKRPISVGDKLANRHGNKGIVSKIVPQEQMPRLEDGRSIDICINPLGIISRMNIGQLCELHLSMSVVDLKTKLNALVAENNQKEAKELLLKYIKIIDKTKDNWYYNQFVEIIPKELSKSFIDSLVVFQPPFESVGVDEIREAMSLTNTNFEFKIFDPILNDYILNPIAAGYIYFFRMIHIAEDRLAARGIGSYSRRTMQPLAGRKNKGGQRVGEMEMAAIIAYDSKYNLYEFLNTKSDCIDLKNKLIQDIIDVDYSTVEHTKSNIPESVHLLNSYLIAAGTKKS